MGHYTCCALGSQNTNGRLMNPSALRLRQEQFSVRCLINMQCCRCTHWLSTMNYGNEVWLKVVGIQWRHRENDHVCDGGTHIPCSSSSTHRHRVAGTLPERNTWEIKTEGPEASHIGTENNPRIPERKENQIVVFRASWSSRVRPKVLLRSRTGCKGISTIFKVLQKVLPARQPPAWLI